MTPTIYYSRISQAIGVDLWVKHDDMFPLAGGGNKARKIRYILDRAQAEGSDALVSAGAAGSNHARVVALMAARLGWKCKLVIHDRADSRHPNLRLMRLAGAELIFTDLASVARVMNEAMSDFRREGANPFYIWGGGHLLEGGLAYYNAYGELIEQLGAAPDFIVCASGTGTTQAGLHTGALLDEAASPRVLGISVARAEARGKAAVVESIRELLAFLGHSAAPGYVEFYDDWIQGGYGKSGPEIFEAIEWAARMEGIVLDPVYTGKAFAGMLAKIRAGEIAPGSKVVFWHTGGLLNLAADEAVGS